MVRLSRVASWRWLLPPASGLTPASVVIVIASLWSRTAAGRSTVRLAAAFVEWRTPGFVDRAESMPSTRSEVLGAGLDRCCVRAWQLLWRC
jgi:hypothetical protein